MRRGGEEGVAQLPWMAVVMAVIATGEGIDLHAQPSLRAKMEHVPVERVLLDGPIHCDEAHHDQLRPGQRPSQHPRDGGGEKLQAEQGRAHVSKKQPRCSPETVDRVRTMRSGHAFPKRSMARRGSMQTRRDKSVSRVWGARQGRRARVSAPYQPTRAAAARTASTGCMRTNARSSLERVACRVA